MNNLLSFWLAPVTALFHPQVYRRAAQSRARRGVFYALYLAGLATVLLTVLMNAILMPQIDQFVVWAKQNTPVLIWTPAGLSIENGQTTASLTHPQYGPIALFDMTKTAVTEADMGNAYIFVTAKKVFIKRAPGQIEERDITGAGIQSRGQLPAKVRFTGEIIGKIFQNAKNAALFIMPIVVVSSLFVFYLLGGLLCSLFGLLFNMGRTVKLRYGAIFNLSCFAGSASFLIMWLRFFTPLRTVPFPAVLSLLLAAAYLFYAFKITEKKPAA